MNKEQIAEYFKTLQDNIVASIEAEDGGAKFQEDSWERDGGGGGRTRIIKNGNVLEKAGVNFSAVEGELPENILAALNLKKSNFFATGVSIVMHPKSPMVPIIHMNVRYFEIPGETWWFGGGIDLTPHYVNDEDATFFHEQMKSACDKHEVGDYARFKKWADDYFFIDHRNETRGVGGIFFDKLNDRPKEEIFEFVKEVGESFAPTYTNLMAKNKNTTYTPAQKEWQKVRRGRYVEFNLVYDKGTKFGLQTAGRIESILMSLPQEVEWHYDYQTSPGSEEERTLSLLKKGVDWAK